MDYQWIATYRDGNGLPQFNADGSENAYKDIDRDRLAAFVLLTREDKPRTVLAVHVPEGGRLIFRRRHEQFGNDANTKVTVWVVGCQSTRGGVNSQHIAVLFPDGHVETCEGWKEGTRWFYAPHLVPGEAWDGIGPSPPGTRV